MALTSRLPGAYDHHWDWQLRGSCRSGGAAALFFHPAGERGEAHDAREEAAKAVCAGCPVRVECRRYALDAREPYGVWGGLTEDERHRLFSGTLARRSAA
ncbi:transcription factor WhiB [Streptomyces tateyamensis]|uniref:Transcriptional regulator WhiB n=1 Tax=Streptomyces tateyamensis TaxID=565073 RepID=A0A2V4NNP7_9ACTN|nr:WhiB family transcriptional regulator [Streptomyces tateyamensis]PYC77413.1 transcription factor WhiB [Streptomyces tateyamensis]